MYFSNAFPMKKLLVDESISKSSSICPQQAELCLQILLQISLSIPLVYSSTCRQIAKIKTFESLKINCLFVALDCSPSQFE